MIWNPLFPDHATMYIMNLAFVLISALTPVYLTESCINARSFISAQQYSSISTGNQISSQFTDVGGLDCVFRCYRSELEVKHSLFVPTERKCLCLKTILDIVDSPQDEILVHVVDLHPPGKFGH